MGASLLALAKYIYYPVLMRKAVQNNVINDGHITVLGNTGDYRGLDESYSLKNVIWP